jgi:hypothetical protein
MMKRIFCALLLFASATTFAQNRKEVKMIQVNNILYDKAENILGLGFSSVLSFANKKEDFHTRLTFGISTRNNNNLNDKIPTNTIGYRKFKNLFNEYAIGVGQEYRQTITPYLYAVIGADAGVNVVAISNQYTSFELDSTKTNYSVRDEQKENTLVSILSIKPFAGLRFNKNRFVAGAEINASVNYGSQFSNTPASAITTTQSNLRMMFGYKIFK